MSDAHSIETWKPIPGWPGYEASDQGRVRSFWKRKGGNVDPGQRVLGPTSKLLRPARHKYGYSFYTLCAGPSVRRNATAHEIVMETFVGPRPRGMFICHNDGDPTNNQLDNLRWATPKENTADRKRHGTHLVGDKAPNAKLTEEQVRDIKRRWAAGENMNQIALATGINAGSVFFIVRGKQWRHVTI